MIRSCTLALVMCLVFTACQQPEKIHIESKHFEFITLEDGVYSCIHKFGGKAICNVGVVDNGKETIIFDCFLSPMVAEELLTALEKLPISPIRYVVNSHFHNDHIRGNQVFSKDVHIISTTRTRELIEEEEPLQIEYEKEKAPVHLARYDSMYHAFTGDTASREYQQILMWRPYFEVLSNSYKNVKTRLPDMFVDTLLQLDGPDRKVSLISKGTGHSESDLILYLPDDEIVFSGDLVFNQCHPYVPHGDITSWKAWLDFMNSLNIQTVMPGHGHIGDRDLIDQMKIYLDDLETTAQELVVNEFTADSIDQISIPDPYQDWWFDRFYAYNLQFAFQALTGEE